MFQAYEKVQKAHPTLSGYDDLHRLTCLQLNRDRLNLEAVVATCKVEAPSSDNYMSDPKTMEEYELTSEERNGRDPSLKRLIDR